MSQTAAMSYSQQKRYPQANTGSWGLPDFGLTERAAGFLSGGKTTDLSNALTGNYGQAPAPNKSVGGPASVETKGQVQGVTAPPVSGGFTYSQPVQSDPSIDQARQEQANQTDRLRQEIGGAYDAYFQGLDQMEGGFSQQRQDQEGIVNSQYNQGRNTLQGQLATGMNQLTGKREEARSGQAKTLRDLENNVRNMFQAGNVYLGSRGAGDSSASNMYSYAVTQMGNKNRGEAMNQTRAIMNDIDGREFELKNTVDTETRNLDEMKNQKMLEVAQWYNESLNNVRQMKAQGQLERGVSLANVTRDLLNQATQRAMMIEQNAMNQKNAIMEWAMQQGQSLQATRQQLAGITNVQYQAPQAGQLNAAPTIDSQGNMYTPAGYGYGEEEKRNSIF